MRIYGEIEIHRNLSAPEMEEVASLLYSKCSRTRADIVGANPFFTLANEVDIRINQRPPEKIFKLARAEHVDAFFNDGTIQLGTVRHYARHENPEIGDKYEDAPMVLIGERIGYTRAVAVEGGYDHYVFCAMLGDADKMTADGFGYDSIFEITDPYGFLSAIGNCIRSKSGSFGRCNYTSYKAMKGIVNKAMRTDRIDRSLIEILGSARNFLKPIKFKHQRELRFTWQMPHETDAPIIIKCPSAVQFARRI